MTSRGATVNPLTPVADRSEMQLPARDQCTRERDAGASARTT